MAYELTALVHGKEEADKAQAAAKALFGGEGDESNMPCTEIEENAVGDKIFLTDLLCLCGLTASKSEAKRLILQGGVAVDGEKVSSIDYVIEKGKLIQGVKIKKGKKVFHKAIIK